MPDNLAKRLPLLLYALVCSVRVQAGEQARDFPLHASALPPSFSLGRGFAENPLFSATEFRPRKSAMPVADPAHPSGAVLDAPMLQGTSIWQQLAQSKAQDRVRLLTLWQAQGSTLSLQAGRHGAPSLQWSTPWVHREEVSRGLFDRLLFAPSRGAASAYRGAAARPSALASTPAAKPADLTPGGTK
jgi:hypothetical protein